MTHSAPAPLEGLLTIFIPRFPWPETSYAPAPWFQWYLGNAESPERPRRRRRHAPDELYWMFGLLES